MSPRCWRNEISVLGSPSVLEQTAGPLRFRANQFRSSIVSHSVEDCLTRSLSVTACRRPHQTFSDAHYQTDCSCGVQSSAPWPTIAVCVCVFWWWWWSSWRSFLHLLVRICFSPHPLTLVMRRAHKREIREAPRLRASMGRDLTGFQSLRSLPSEVVLVLFILRKRWRSAPLVGHRLGDGNV